MRCPGCRKVGIFPGVLQHDAAFMTLVEERTNTRENRTCGLRWCPDPACRAIVFVVLRGAEVVSSFPAERIEFDTSEIPERVVRAFEEAIACHADQCFVAAAMLIRKGLEELCEDRVAKGDTLKARIADLRTKVLIPTDLLDGADELRILGNEAAHVKSKDYDQIGQAEVETALEFSKELLKAVYQYKALLKRLQQLKKAHGAAAAP